MKEIIAHVSFTIVKDEEKRNSVLIEISIILAGSESWVLFANKEEWRCHRGLWRSYIAFFQIFF